jgi:hypothetical protein
MNSRNLARTSGGFVEGMRRALLESQVIEERDDGKCYDLLYNARISFCRPECRRDIEAASTHGLSQTNSTSMSVSFATTRPSTFSAELQTLLIHHRGGECFNNILQRLGQETRL